MRPLYIAAGLACMACNADAQSFSADHTEHHELAVPATFALTLSKATALNREPLLHGPDKVTVTSGNIGAYYKLPADARCYWIFDFEGAGPVLAGTLVMASKDTGEIYKEFAHGFGTTLFELIDGAQANKDGLGVSLMGLGKTSIIVNMAITWKFQSDAPPVGTFARFALHIEEDGDGSQVSLSSLTELAGDGLDKSKLLVTQGRLQATGRVRGVIP